MGMWFIYVYACIRVGVCECGYGVEITISSTQIRTRSLWISLEHNPPLAPWVMKWSLTKPINWSAPANTHTHARHGTTKWTLRWVRCISDRQVLWFLPSLYCQNSWFYCRMCEVVDYNVYIYIHYICTIVRIVKVHSSIWMLMKASHYAAGILELLLGAGITQPINGSHSLERNKIGILLSTCSHGLVRSNALWRKVVYCWVSTYFIVECGSMRNQAVRKCERISTMHEKRNQESWGWTTPLPNNRLTTNQLKVVDKENIIYSIKWHEGNAYYFLPPPKALLFYDE